MLAVNGIVSVCFTLLIIPEKVPVDNFHQTHGPRTTSDAHTNFKQSIFIVEVTSTHHTECTLVDVTL
jgi:hypothetical protein